MSYDSEIYSFEPSPGQGLSVLECGLITYHSGHSSSRLIHSDYSAHFILRGKCVNYINDQEYRLDCGQGFIIAPNVPYSLVVDKNDPSQSIYISFRGPDSENIVRNAGLNYNNVIFSFPTDEAMLHDLKCMYTCGIDQMSKGYNVLGYFILVMSRLIRNNQIALTDSLREGRYIQSACSFIHTHITHGITVKNIADYVKIDRSHLFRLFKKHLGMSPSQYITQEKLKLAIELMGYKDLSINEVAASSGFYDVSHFYRVFTKKYKTSPYEYRIKKLNSSSN